MISPAHGADPSPEAGSASALGEASRGSLRLIWRPLSFPLAAPLRTAVCGLTHRQGWLLRMETAEGTCGWGEAFPLAAGSAEEAALESCALALRQLGPRLARADLERQLSGLHPALAFALGAALAELDGLVGPAAGGWRQAPPSAWLLPAGEEALPAARALLEAGAAALAPPTLKWKVGVYPADQEQAWYRELVGLLPPGGRMRLDANGGWDRAKAWSWAEVVRGDPALDWLEQPLAPADEEGLLALARWVPVALDESLREHPELHHSWPGWQVRRPSQEGDPRPLLRELQAGRPWLMVSTSFETGIGGRWLAHLAALQAAGPTPTAPGLAPGWQATGQLQADAPERVWQAALEGDFDGAIS